jgi:hypothetical protein
MKTLLLLLAASLAPTSVIAQQPSGRPIPCPPAASICKGMELEIDPQDLTHFQILLTIDINQIEVGIKPIAETQINAHLPLAVTQEVQIGNVKNINAKVLLDWVRIGPYGPPPMPGPIHPPQPSPSSQAHHPGPRRAGTTHDTIPLSIAGRIQKDEVDWEVHPFPLPGHAGWEDKGWRDCASFTALGTLATDTDRNAPIFQQNLKLTADIPNAQVIMTNCFLMGTKFQVPLAAEYGATLTIMDENTANQYGLQGMTIRSVEPQAIFTDINGKWGTFLLDIGTPLPASRSRHRP